MAFVTSNRNIRASLFSLELTACEESALAYPRQNALQTVPENCFATKYACARSCKWHQRGEVWHALGEAA
jgi:hypothetical protein